MLKQSFPPSTAPPPPPAPSPQPAPSPAPPPQPLTLKLLLAPVATLVAVRVGVVLVKDATRVLSTVLGFVTRRGRGRGAAKDDAKGPGTAGDGGGEGGGEGGGDAADGAEGRPRSVAVSLSSERVSASNGSDASSSNQTASAPGGIAVLPKVVSDSAKSIAALRAMEAERGASDALFRDPFAAALAGEDAMAGCRTGTYTRPLLSST
jgi:hypothetical protein